MRTFGILLHISSLPSAFGIGDMGPAAHDFARSLGAARASIWQFLPLNPTSTFIGNSPYSSPSAFAGNPLFISPEWLVRDGYVSHADLDSCRYCLPPEGFGSDPSRVDFAAVAIHRAHLLHAAFERSSHRLSEDPSFQVFCREHHHWLHDYARFVSLKDEHGGAAWSDWPRPLAHRESAALEAWDQHASRAVLREKFIQFLFFTQWQELRRTCREQRVRLLADIPIYVTMDSADVWANPGLFQLDEELRPVAVSGVPPDYFSETGQRWGTPLYRWDMMKRDGFSWWKQRLAQVLLHADIARLDHFRGFCGYWEIPEHEETAMNGVWRRGPGKHFLASMQQRFGDLPFVAEDLGVITDDVREAIRDFNLPGMHVLQFAFGWPDPARNTAAPHLHAARSVVYTGTHDNTPTRAWFQTAPEFDREAFSRYCGQDVHVDTATGQLTRLAFASVADWAVVPMQDALDLGAADRMNIPGLAAGNWAWRMRPDQAGPDRLAWLTELATVYGRLPLCAKEPKAEEEVAYID